MGMMRKRESLRKWWKVVGLLIVIAIGFSVVVSMKWDEWVALSGAEEPTEYSQKDMMSCQAGTHQEHGRCIANKVKPASAAAAATPAPAAPK